MAQREVARYRQERVLQGQAAQQGRSGVATVANIRRNISEQKTAPLPPVAATPFHEYLLAHKLLWVQVARAARVPVLTVWSIDHGLAVDPAQAIHVRQGLYLLTGSPYTGPIETIVLANASKQGK